MSHKDALPTEPQLTVLYDGKCPLCSREITWYQCQHSDTPIRWVDVGNPSTRIPFDIQRSVALARFHVVGDDGSVQTGARAFIRLWLAYPRLAPIARRLSHPRMVAILEFGYRLFLPIRPWLARFFPKPK